MATSASRNATNRRALEDLAAAGRLPLEVLDLDVTDDRSVQSGQEALRRAGRLDVVINNAGIAGIGVTEAYTPEQFQGMFDVNVFGPVRVNRAVLPSMRAQGSGLLIHVSSGAGRLIVPAMAAYCASKFALEALADAVPLRAPAFWHRLRARRARHLPDAHLRSGGCAGRPGAPRPIWRAGRVPLNGCSGCSRRRSPIRTTREATRSRRRSWTSSRCPAADRPLRTIVSSRIQPLLDPYNQTANALRTVVAQIFNVEELALPPGAKAVAG